MDDLRLQMKLEGKGIDSGNRLIQSVPDTEIIPYVLIASFSNQKTVYYADARLPKAIQSSLDEAALSLTFPNVRPFEEILKANDLRFQTGHYKTYTFPERYLQYQNKDVRTLLKYDAKVTAFDPNNIAERVFAIERDDKIVSACVSSRQDDSSAEAWVYTVPEFRRKGFGVAVVSAWAAGMMNEGLVPFYSHEISNRASESLANHLELIARFEEISIEPA